MVLNNHKCFLKVEVDLEVSVHKKDFLDVISFYVLSKLLGHLMNDL